MKIRRLIIITLLLLIGFVTLPSNVSAVDVTGSWKIYYYTDTHSKDTMDLTQHGNVLSGIWAARDMVTPVKITGSITGDTVCIDVPIPDVPCRIDAKVSQDVKATMEGTWTVNDGPLKGTHPWRAEKKIEKKAQTTLQTYRVPPDTGDGWETTNISSVALDEKLLLKMVDQIRKNVYPNIHSVLIVKDNKLVMEEYYAGKNSSGVNIDYNIDSLHELHSVTKSFNSALIGIAIGQKLIPNVDTNIVELLPQYTDLLNNNLKKGIKLRNLLTMTTGIKWDESTYPYTDARNDHIRMNNSYDPVRFVLSQPMETLPGWKFVYNSGISLSLGEIIPGVSKLSVAQFAEKYLFQPLGIEKYYWYRYPNGTYQTGGGLYLRPRDMAKFGLLFINGGRWKSKQIVPETWVKESMKNHIDHLKIGTKYGYQWWPRTFWVGNRSIDTINAEGRGGQFIIIVPDLKLVAVFTGWNDNYLYRQPINLLVEYILPSAIDE